jgi:hypothetical protein
MSAKSFVGGCAITEYKIKNDIKLDVVGTLKIKAVNGSFEDFVHYVQTCLQRVDGFYQWFDKKYKSKDFSIVAKIGEGFYIDLSLLRKCYNLLKND